MSIQYLGLSEINGPLIALEGVQDAAFDEIVEITVDKKEKKPRARRRSANPSCNRRRLRRLR